MGLRLSGFFWSLIERPSVTILEMLQRANQYMVAKELEAGKHEDHKRQRAEKPRGQPIKPSKRRHDRLDCEYWLHAAREGLGPTHQFLDKECRRLRLVTQSHVEN